MFPANIYAADSGLATDWWDAVLPRTLLHVLFLAATIAVVVLTRRPSSPRLADMPADARA